jgi:hypothetical protein
MVFHVDRGRILQHQFTPEGFLRAYMRIARVGELRYYNLDGTERVEVVTPEVLFNKDSIDSFKMKPLTLKHPQEGKVTPKNFRKYGRGLTGHTAVIDGDFLGLVSTIADEEMIEEVVSGRADQTSCGYDAPIRQRNDGKYDQVERRGNHIAAVPHGRAGADVGFHLDAAEEYWLQVRCDDDGDFDESQIEKLLSTENLVNRLLNLDEIEKSTKVYISKKDEGIPTPTDQVNSPLIDRKDSPKMTTVTLGNRTYNIDGDDAPKLADAVAEFITKNDADLTSAKSATVAETKRADAAEAKLEVVSAEKTQLTQKLDAAEQTRMDADQISTEVEARLGTWQIVLPLLRSDAADFQPDYKLSVSEIQKLAISKKFPEIKLDGKSDDAIAAMWELTEPALKQVETRTDSSLSLLDLVQTAQRQDAGMVGKKSNSIAKRRADRSKKPASAC